MDRAGRKGRVETEMKGQHKPGSDSRGSTTRWSKGAKKLGNRAGHFHQSLITYTRQISELGKCRQWAQALEILKAMQRQGVVPNVITYNALISACGKGKQPERAI